MGSLGVWSTLLGAAVVLVCFLRFLRVLYRDGRLHAAELRAARGAQLPPLLILAAVLGVEILVVDRFPALVDWIPSIISVTALLGAVLVVERARSAVLAHRRRDGEPG
ncbi:hypothetical protein MUN77_09500 [Leucobacter allii]|uniref:hypothetical protein n=1 Tax=Leucobacter allii TaxID=2932247 RepID=UPI001FCFBA58|nr:hypothetical protein [Leucobacter allii]UOR00407.1 hypothetical protein MUN77_09500 [Leucobacter allii]